MPDFRSDKGFNKYEFMRGFGMYRPGRGSWATFEELKEKDIWGKTDRIYKKYKSRWKGPDIPVNIFPMDLSNERLMNEGRGKSGVSFRDSLFLFLTPIEDEKQLEALFIHEYHHVCRLQAQKKSIRDNTLLDSIVLEGLAEHIVELEIGRENGAQWCDRYSEEQLLPYWKQSISKNLEVKKHEPLHDKILFGIGRYPTLLGYAAGYDLIRKYKQKKKLTIKDSIDLPAVTFREFVP
ncbi:hypothetical protein D1970_20330 [Mesobacillus zeae]|uniref:DUF2268 domain-containing protein n=2 Tax=Mesobacillus zeae TaxID=1917180 RepID=A0A398AWV5_9BACI|nr:hypothetical protein D1970_20330 [Mesobacillus zeae]